MHSAAGFLQGFLYIWLHSFLLLFPVACYPEYFPLWKIKGEKVYEDFQKKLYAEISFTNWDEIAKLNYTKSYIQKMKLQLFCPYPS